MAETATAEVLPKSDALQQVPAEGASPPTGQPEGGSSAQAEPGKPGEAQATTRPELPEPNVPWGRFREVQTSYTRLKREHEAAVRDATTKVTQFERDLTEARQVKSDYEALSEALRAHPDIAEALHDRLGRGRLGGGAPAGTVALPPEVSKRLEKLDTLDKIMERIQKAEQTQQQAEIQAADRQVEQQLDQHLTKLLTDRGYEPEWLGDAKEHVFGRIRTMGPDADVTMDDVTYLFAEWYRKMEKFASARTGTTVAGARDAQRLPPVPGGSPPITPAPTAAGALDGNTARALEEQLRQRGWTG